MFNSPFGSQKKSIKDIILNSDIVFVSDFFVEDYKGGAELTTDALINTSGNFKIAKISTFIKRILYHYFKLKEC